MKQYYYANGDQQLGPFSFQELQSKRLSKDTYVWYEGLSDWTRAGDLPELNQLFEERPTQTPPQRPTVEQSPPPPAQTGYQQQQNQGGGYQQQRQQQQYQQPVGAKPKTWLVEAILITILCCIFPGIVAVVYASKVDSKWAQGDAAGAQKASDDAKMWLMISLGFAGVIILFYVVYIIALASSF